MRLCWVRRRSTNTRCVRGRQKSRLSFDPATLDFELAPPPPPFVCKELQTIKMKNDAMFGEVKTINKNGRIDLTWESGKDKPSHTLPVFFSRHTSHFPYIDLTWESGKISSHTTPSVSRMSHFHFPYISPISILIRQDVFTHTCHFIYLMCHTSHFS